MSDLRISGIRLVCRDLPRSIRFYHEAFGCVFIGAETADLTNGAEIALGRQRLHLVPARAEGAGGRSPEARDGPPVSNATGFQHLAIVVSNMDDAMRQLERSADWEPISSDGPERLPDASGGATAFKFRDPDGHPLEFLQFPPDAVPERWQDLSAPGPCLGIDHSAITVADVDRAIRFYKGLGFRQGERQRNIGAEQGRMDGLGNYATCDVVALRPPCDHAPHLELLGYVAPRTVEIPVPDGSPFATTLLLTGTGRNPEYLRDPDGHRIERLA
ncbi:VOC family protein [Fulvimarina endophytica]|nr:VOC family protein [Fulvimarina endophytica]